MFRLMMRELPIFLETFFLFPLFYRKTSYYWTLIEKFKFTLHLVYWGLKRRFLTVNIRIPLDRLRIRNI